MSMLCDSFVDVFNFAELVFRTNFICELIFALYLSLYLAHTTHFRGNNVWLYCQALAFPNFTTHFKKQ